MKVIENDENSLLIVDQPWRLALLFSVIGLIALFMFIKYFSSLNQVQMIGAGVNLVFLGFIIYATRKKAYMHFDNKAKIVKWYREEVYETKQGTFEFDEIKTVVIQEVAGTDGRSYRVAIKLKNEEVVPLVMYSSAMKRHKEVRVVITSWLEKYSNYTEA